MTPIVSATVLRTQSDARLVALVRQGGERAFEAIVERYRRPLHRYCRRMLPDSRSEDAVQQTFLKAWSALQGDEEIRDLKPWLYRIARNTSLDALKKAGYDYDELTHSLRAVGTPAEDLERRTVMRETLTGLAALPERQRDVLLRVAVQGQSRAQVAAELGISDGAVRQLAHRARITMRAAVTAVTPLPLVSWAAAFARNEDHVRERIAELAAGGGAAGVTGALVKGGAVIVAAGALATGPGALTGGGAHRDSSAAEAAQTDGQHNDRGSGSSNGFAASALQAVGRDAPVQAAGAGTGSRAIGAGPARKEGTDDRSGPSGGDLGALGPGTSAGGDDRSGPGGGGDHSGPGGGGDAPGTASGSGDLGSLSSGSGSSGSGDSGSLSSGSGSSGSGDTGSLSSGSGDTGGGDSGSRDSGDGSSSGPGPAP